MPEPIREAVAGAKAAVISLVKPIFPPFMELAANVKNLVSGKLIKEAIKKKVDTVKKVLDPTEIGKQLTGDKKTGIVASIVPRQVRQLAQAYKQGLKLTPKEAITSTLEKFTGVNLDQHNLLESLGSAAINAITSEINALKNTFMSTIIGCVNKAVRDLINKFPALDFLINLEDKLSSILGNFRNKLEQRIDAELRGLMYNKIKIHQLTLFKQRLHGSIRGICPEATPASSAEVAAFMNAYEEGKRKRQLENAVDTTSNQIDEQEPPKPKRARNTSYRPEVSEKKKKEYRENPQAVEDVVNKNSANITAAVTRTATEQAKTKNISNNKVSSIVNSNSKLKGGRATYVEVEDRKGAWMSEEERQNNKELHKKLYTQLKNNPHFNTGSNGATITSNTGGFTPTRPSGGVSQEQIATSGYETLGLENPDTIGG